MSLKQVIRDAFIIRIAQGVTLGLYLYNYQLSFRTALSSGYGFQLDSEDVDPQLKLLLALIFMSGIILEAFLELPLGAYGDIRGYKSSLKLSFIFRLLFFTGLILVVNYTSQSIPLSFLTIFLFSFAYSFWSGSFSAWFYDSLSDFNATDAHEKYNAKTLMVYWISFVLSVITAPYIYYMEGLIVSSSILLYAVGAIICLAAYIHIRYFMYTPKIQRSITEQTISVMEVWQSYRNTLSVVLSGAVRHCIRNKYIFRLLQLWGFYYLLVFIIDYPWNFYVENIMKISKNFYGEENSEVYRTWYTFLIGSLSVGLALGVYLGLLSIGEDETNSDRTRAAQWNRLMRFGLIFAIPIIPISLMEIFSLREQLQVGTLIYGVDGNVVYFLMLMVVFFISSVGQGAMEAPYDALMNSRITEATSAEMETGINMRATIMSVATMFRTVIVFFFFVPIVHFSRLWVEGWFIPAVALVLFAYWGRKKFLSQYNKG